MEMRFFSIPMNDDGRAAEVQNRFLRVNRVASIERHLVQDGGNSAWVVAVTYIPGEGRPESAFKPRVDYKERLSEPDFALFLKLRELRKELSDRDGVPAYHVFNNDQLEQIVLRKVRTAAALREIRGVGDARVERRYATSWTTPSSRGRIGGSPFDPRRLPASTSGYLATATPARRPPDPCRLPASTSG